MRLRRAIAAFAMALAFAPSALAQKSAPAALQRIDREHLCVTNGAATALPGGRLAIDTSSSRGFVQAGTDRNAADQVAEIRFQYLGPSQDSKPLASGELRRQIGLKLRAQDSCNLIYAMWRIEPAERVAVSVKRNAGLHTHAQCGVQGYVNFKPQEGEGPPPLRAGEAHTLRAELRGRDLTVIADGRIAWQGALGTEALPIGPPGFRTDNARFALEYFTDAAGSRRASQRASPGACVMAEGD